MLECSFGLNDFSYYVEQLLKKEMQHKEINECPFCKGKRYIRYGKYSGIQRFKCKECRKTFSLRTNTVFEYSKKSCKTWIEFIELFIEKQSLRYCSRKLNINLATAFYWRHKILSAINSTERLKKLKGEVHIAKTSIRENFKGKRNIESFERRNVIVVGGVDIKDTMISMSLCKEMWSYKIFNQKIYNHIDKNSYIVSYGDRYLYKIASNHNKGKAKKLEEELRMKFFSKLFHIWFKDFRGIATKNLDKYLSWFILDQLKKSIDWIKVTNYIISLFTFIKTQEVCKG